MHAPDICRRKGWVIWHILALTSGEMLICQSRWLFGRAAGDLWRARALPLQGKPWPRPVKEAQSGAKNPTSADLFVIACLESAVCLSLLYVWGSWSGVTDWKEMVMPVALETWEWDIYASFSLSGWGWATATNCLKLRGWYWLTQILDCLPHVGPTWDIPECVRVPGRTPEFQMFFIYSIGFK